MHQEPEPIPTPSLWRELVERLPVVVYVADFDARATLRWVSPQIERLLGHPAAAFIEDQELWYRCIHPDDVDRVRAEEQRVHSEVEAFDCEFRMITADGRVLDVWERDTLVRGTDGRPWCTQGVLVDVTSLREAERRADHLMRHDGLTGLPNRALMTEHLDLAVARARRDGSAVGLLIVDLDDFKLVNEALGAAGGDRVLTQVARRFQARRRAQDVLARVGADEFAVLLTGLDAGSAEEDAVAVARGYQGLLRAPFEVDGTVFEIGASIGCAVFPVDAPDGAELRRRAWSALHAGKRTGRGEIRRFQAGAAAGRRPLTLTARLRAAMEHDELVLHWQPIVDPLDGVLRGAEALVRWQSSEGLLAPGTFVPFAEESGLIHQLDDHVLGLAAAEMARWGRTDGLHFGVNVSPSTFAAPGYAERVRERLSAHRVDPAQLVLELTESAVMRAGTDVVPILRSLKELGVALAIDDFGAGFSSLTRLIEMPVDVLKLDRAFLARGARDPATVAMINAILGMSRALGIQTVVEGVERADQQELLCRLGAPLAQGYLLGRPAPAAELVPRLRAARPAA